MRYFHLRLSIRKIKGGDEERRDVILSFMSFTWKCTRAPMVGVNLGSFPFFGLSMAGAARSLPLKVPFSFQIFPPPPKPTHPKCQNAIKIPKATFANSFR